MNHHPGPQPPHKAASTELAYPPPAPVDPGEYHKEQAETRSRVTALAMAVLIHGLIFALLAWIIVGTFTPPETMIEFVPPEGETKPVIDRDTFAKRVLRHSPAPGGPAINVIDQIAPAEVSIASVEAPSDTFGSGIGDAFGQGYRGNGPGPVGGPVGIPPVLKNRCSQTDRLRRLREGGGTPALDRQVVRALDWLKAQQNADGSWGSNYPVAMTGFALLAFCGHCETVDSPRYGPNLVKAINYLIGKARDGNGLMASKPGSHTSYGHGIATYALAEAYSLNKNARAKTKRISTALRNAVPVIIEGQTKGGGWLYGYGQSGTGDLSISGWNIQALKAAELTGLKFSGMARCKKNALAYLRAAVTSEGLYKYRIRDGERGRLSLTGVGVLCGRMLGTKLANEGRELRGDPRQAPRAVPLL